MSAPLPSKPSSDAAPFERLLNLASARLGAFAVAANDDFFAPKERLVADGTPEWREGLYTDFGKWMDGWETRRRRRPGHDWCVVRLGLPGVIRGVVVDTSWFRGNYPEACAIEACAAPAEAGIEELRSDATEWIRILRKSPLEGDARNRFAIASPHRFTHVRLRIFPDGGVARLRVHGAVVPDPADVDRAERLVDLAGLANGGAVGETSDEFFGSRHHLLLPGRSRGMFDGWETRRRRGPGHDWVVFRLAGEGSIERVVVDTSHFKGNAPGWIAVDVADELEALDRGGEEEGPWRPLLPLASVRADQRRVFARRLEAAGAARVARLRIVPDGGVARLRLFGTLTTVGRIEIGLAWLNALSPSPARATFLECLGSQRWADGMVAARPFDSLSAIEVAATRAAASLAAADWQAAFACHPRIGETRAAAKTGTREAGWSSEEQSASRTDDEALRKALAAGNARYEKKFGHVFLIAARGRDARSILDELERRLTLDAEAELANAAQALTTIATQRLARRVAALEEAR